MYEPSPGSYNQCLAKISHVQLSVSVQMLLVLWRNIVCVHTHTHSRSEYAAITLSEPTRTIEQDL